MDRRIRAPRERQTSIHWSGWSAPGRSAVTPQRRPRPGRTAHQGHRDHRPLAAVRRRTQRRHPIPVLRQPRSTLDYRYQLDGDVLTIWAGERDSPAYYRGTFSPDGRSCWRRRIPVTSPDPRRLVVGRDPLTRASASHRPASAWSKDLAACPRAGAEPRARAAARPVASVAAGRRPRAGTRSAGLRPWIGRWRLPPFA